MFVLNILFHNLLGTNRPNGWVRTDRKWVRNVWAWVRIVRVQNIHGYETTEYLSFYHKVLYSNGNSLFSHSAIWNILQGSLAKAVSYSTEWVGSRHNRILKIPRFSQQCSLSLNDGWNFIYHGFWPDFRTNYGVDFETFLLVSHNCEWGLAEGKISSLSVFFECVTYPKKPCQRAWETNQSVWEKLNNRREEQSKGFM